MTRGGLAMTIKTLLLRKRSSSIITPKAVMGRYMSKVADDGREVQSFMHKVRGQESEYEEHEESCCWIPDPRTGIYYPKGYERVIDDVPDGAACFPHNYWFRNTDIEV